MDCNIVKDLIPLYIDGCCSEQSEIIVQEHIKVCGDCKKLFEDMNTPSDIVTVSVSPKPFSKLNDWKASVLQSVLLFVSFAIITIGVALEAKTPSGLMNGFWAMNLVVPATGFMLSLANWYFVSVYKNRKAFSNCSFLITLGITLCAFLWSWIHYGGRIIDLFGLMFSHMLDFMQSLLFMYGAGLLLTVVFCVLSKILSIRYAKLLGKE